jgi:NADH dehydrogenase FAD-containing subunit
LLLLFQVAKQQGEFLAEVLSGGQWDKRRGGLAMKPQQEPFSYFHKGSLVSQLRPIAVCCVLKVLL